MTVESEERATFESLGLPQALLRAIDRVGYEAPSMIQEAAIPVLLSGRDLIGQAQTGTGKTAAFALPLLARLDLAKAVPQLLVITPTRELALQVAEAIQTYAHYLDGLHVLPVYGGQGMETQLRRLHRGVHVIVGTPGRIQDHLDRGTLNLGALRALVLDEADEMLRMGFIDAVTAILEKTPASRQTALFSATMPPVIARMAQKFLRDPEHIEIATRTATVETIRQRYVAATGHNKLEALTRILEVEPFEGMLIFVRTRSSTAMLAEKLEARGFAASPLSGEMSQHARQRAVDRLKRGDLDILICTDVAARGLDVERVSHVVNYDIPTDAEAYVHRIGRTGRAGREGQAITFVARREHRLLKMIEHRTKQPIEAMSVPSGAQIGEQRIGRLKDLLSDTIRGTKLGFFEEVVDEYVKEAGNGEDESFAPGERSVAAALLYLFQRERPLMVPDRNVEDRAPRQDQGRPAERRLEPEEVEQYRIDIGKTHGLEPGHVVGCIANEADISSRRIGKVRIFEDHTIVDLPRGMPKDIEERLGRAWVRGRQLKIRSLDRPEAAPEESAPSPPKAPPSPPKAPKSPPKAPKSPPPAKAKPRPVASAPSPPKAPESPPPAKAKPRPVASAQEPPVDPELQVKLPQDGPADVEPDGGRSAETGPPPRPTVKKGMAPGPGMSKLSPAVKARKKAKKAAKAKAKNKGKRKASGGDKPVKRKSARGPKTS